MSPLILQTVIDAAFEVLRPSLGGHPVMLALLVEARKVLDRHAPEILKAAERKLAQK